MPRPRPRSPSAGPRHPGGGASARWAPAGHVVRSPSMWSVSAFTAVVPGLGGPARRLPHRCLWQQVALPNPKPAGDAGEFHDVEAALAAFQLAVEGAVHTDEVGEPPWLRPGRVRS